MYVPCLAQELSRGSREQPGTLTASVEGRRGSADSLRCLQMDLGRIELRGKSVCLLPLHRNATSGSLLPKDLLRSCSAQKQKQQRRGQKLPMTTGVSTSRLTRAEENKWDFTALESLSAGLDTRGR